MKVKRKKLGVWLIALVLLVVGQMVYQQETFAYNVVLEGKVLFQVDNKQAMEKVLEEYKAQAARELGQEVETKDELVLEKAKKDSRLLVDDSLELFITARVPLVTEAYTIIVDGKPLFSVLKKEDAQNLLKDYQERFNMGIDEETEIVSTAFKENVKIEQENVEVAQIYDLEKAKEKLNTPQESDLTLEIKQGDNFWNIAQQYGITVDMLLQLNPGVVPEKMQLGDRILIKPSRPQINVLTTLQSKVKEEIPATTKYIEDSSMLSNERRVMENGVNGEKEVLYQVVLENGHESIIEALEETVIKEPVERVIKRGTKKVLSRGVGRNYGVVSGTRVTSDYGWRIHPIFKTRRFHDGIDIAAPTGRGVYSYSSGTVAFAGWTSGLGQAVYIDHGNGLQTRYGHLSKINVKKGAKVSAGQKIGAVGSTGLSTGPHLHFEVRKNGSTQTPWNYI